MQKNRLKILALGGNEVSPTGKIDNKTGKLIIPDLPEQWRRTAETCEILAKIIKKHEGEDFILTHGNGPQVGNIILRAEYARPILHRLPLDVCDADTQGAMGYMLAQLTNALQMVGIDKIVAETVTRVVINDDDPDFTDPTKFIGPSYSKEEAVRRQEEDGHMMKFYKLDEKGHELWRWVVPSPVPVDIVEIDIIENNLRTGAIPIAVGGGGIPVKLVKPQVSKGKEIYECNYGIEYARPHSPGALPAAIYTGVEAVIDKDLASALLGTLLIERAERRGEKLDAELVIFTDVDGAKLNYQRPDQVDLRHLTLQEAKDLYDKKVFPDGSMGPKIKAAINFITGGGRRALITKADLYDETLRGKAGTIIE